MGSPVSRRLPCWPRITSQLRRWLHRVDAPLLTVNVQRNQPLAYTSPQLLAVQKRGDTRYAMCQRLRSARRFFQGLSAPDATSRPVHGR